MTCAELEGLAAELALGTVSGAERAGALDHLAGCVACRELVADLAQAADRLLLLAPAAEPPPGFESKVLARMGVAVPSRHSHRPRRRRVLAGVAAAALVAAMSAVGATWLSGGTAPAPEIRTALASDANGHWTCRAVVYGDKPTWLVVSLDRTDGLSAAFTVDALGVGRDTPVPVGSFSIDQGHGSLAIPVGLAAEDLRSVRVFDAGGRLRYEMTFPVT